jgi:hypothetical protein
MTDSRLAEHGGALRLTPRNGGILPAIPAILKVVRRVASFDFLGVEFCVDGMSVIPSGRADSGSRRRRGSVIAPQRPREDSRGRKAEIVRSRHQGDAGEYPAHLDGVPA